MATQPASLRHSLPTWFVLFLVALLWSQRAYLPFLIPQKVYAVPGTATFGGTGGTGGNVYGNIFYDHDNTSYFLDPNATGTSLAVAGSVGIGTTGPGAKLDVQGGNINTSGTVTALTSGSSFGPGGTSAGQSVLYLNAPNNVTTSYATLIAQQNGSSYGQLDWDAAGNQTFLDYKGALKFRAGYSGTEMLRLSAAGGISLGSTYVGTDPGAGNAIISGNVGIGTTAPSNKVHIEGGPASGVPLVYIKDTSNTGNGTDIGLRINMSAGTSNPKFMQFYSDAQQANGVGSIQSCAGTGTCYQSGTGDFGEYMTMSESVDYGDIIGVLSDGSKVKALNNHTVVGVYTDTPAFVGNAKHDQPLPNEVIVGLVGQIKTKVSTMNGPINPGDFISASQIPGVGAKAIQAGQVVGRALESYDNPDLNAVGKILIYVNASWYDPDLALTSTGDLAIVAKPDGTYGLQDKTGSPITLVAAFSEAAIANVKAGLINAKRIILDGVDVAKKLDELSTKLNAQQQQIDQLKAEIESLKK